MQREVELIGTTYQDISYWLSARASDGLGPGGEEANKHQALMASCREYLGSRLSSLRERLSQVGLWARSRDMGCRIANQPLLVRWYTADTNWRRRLGEQAVVRQGA